MPSPLLYSTPASSARLQPADAIFVLRDNLFMFMPSLSGFQVIRSRTNGRARPQCRNQGIPCSSLRTIHIYFIFPGFLGCQSAGQPYWMVLRLKSSGPALTSCLGASCDIGRPCILPSTSPLLKLNRPAPDQLNDTDNNYFYQIIPPTS